MEKVKNELSVLHPGKDVTDVWVEYQRKRKRKTAMVVMVSFFFVCLSFFSEIKDSVIDENGQIERKDVGELSRELMLDAYVGEQVYEEIPLEVMAREYTQDEIKQRMEELIETLPEQIKGENASLDYVDGPLNLPTKDEKSPILITWESSNYDVLNTDGTIGTEIDSTGEFIELDVTLSHEETEKTGTYELMVYPRTLSQSEEYLMIINDSVAEAEEASRTTAYMQLPSTIGGETVVWKEHKKSEFVLFLFLVGLSGFAVYWGMNQEVHQQYEKRNQELMMDYSRFVSQLQLFIGSGLSVREALQKIGNDYLKQREEQKEKRYVYEELLLAIRKMNHGASEIEALEFFSKQCNLMCYKKISAIVSQNIRRGTEGLTESLQEEVERAFEERKMLAKKLGEEASTKLLLPMMLIMGMVLVIIVFPAFLSFGGI